ncbi:MAG: ABC transporter ATP-binding protein [Planctomycetales bacterium]|nr:ABC transporter ATP-binding protein [Planctomycetales bacterium]
MQPSESPLALDVNRVDYSYGAYIALQNLSLSIESGQIFALLGPNGSGKTTLFRLIGTLSPLQSGDIFVFGQSVRHQQGLVRGLLGVVFQAPSLDAKLTVLENIQCQAALYGLSGSTLRNRIAEVTKQMGITDRLNSLTGQLSGGLKRRVELAKGILHRPRLLLLDEPSTGLDPASRLDLWHALTRLRDLSGTTIVLTTHLLDEADKADRIAIMHAGQTVAVGRPQVLRQELGGQILSIQTDAPEVVTQWLADRQLEAQAIGNQLRVTGPMTVSILEQLTASFGTRLQSLTLGQPSLEDVFIARTGHQFWSHHEPE